MRIVLFFICLFFSAQTTVPEPIGYTKSEIRTYMKKFNRGMRLTKEVKGKKPYIKYEDYVGERTFIFRLDEEQNCKYVVRMYDYSLLSEVTEKIKSSSKVINDSCWVSSNNEKELRYELRRKKWFFSVIVKPNKD